MTVDGPPQPRARLRFSAYTKLIEELQRHAQGQRYFAHYIEPSVPVQELSHEQAEDYVDVYLMGILERCHLACITSLARSVRWMRATEQQRDAANILGFSASLRGFLEAAADANDVLMYLLQCLHHSFPLLYLRLHKSQRNLPVPDLEHLENLLIHYAFARRHSKQEKALPHHANRSNAQYIAGLEAMGASGAKSLYSDLCELTHPAAASVDCFMHATAQESALDFNQDAALIEGILDTYEDTINTALGLSANPALLSLAILSRIMQVAAPEPRVFAGIGNASAILTQLDRFQASANLAGFAYSHDQWLASL